MILISLPLSFSLINDLRYLFVFFNRMKESIEQKKMLIQYKQINNFWEYVVISLI